MKKRMWRRIICCLLAAQMLFSCAYGATPPAAPLKENDAIIEDVDTIEKDGNTSTLPMLELTASMAVAPYTMFYVSYGYTSYNAGPAAKDIEYDRIAMEMQGKIPTKMTSSGSWSSDESGTFWLKDIKLTNKTVLTEIDLGRMPDRVFETWHTYGADLGSPKDEEKYPENYIISNKDYPLSSDGSIDMEELKNHIAKDNIYIGIYGFDNYELPLIAHWMLSSNATLVDSTGINPDRPGVTARTESTALRAVISENGVDDVLEEPLTLYESGNMTTEVDFSADRDTYYVRVPASVEALDFSLLATEPFRDKGIDLSKSGVRIKATQVGETTSEEYRLDCAVLNDNTKAVVGGGSYYTTWNTPEYPMRSKWTTDGGSEYPYIPLTASAGTGNYYNKIEVIVTPPNGEAGDSKTYTFYVQRLNEPHMLQNPGNTPFGMVARDNGDVWKLAADKEHTTVAQEKQKCKTAFVENNYRFEKQPYPSGSLSNNGKIYLGTYFASAWKDQNNIDLDENAVVVYQDSSFIDPGFTIVDTQGDIAAVGGGNDAQRSITLRMVDRLSVADLTDTAGDRYYYNGTKLVSAEGVADTYIDVDDSNGEDIIDLRGQNVVPGIYQMEYAYYDTLADKTFTSDPDTFLYGKDDKAPTFSRMLVVLPIFGDVDMDGAVTAADAELLRRALHPGDLDVDFLSRDDVVTALFKARVCDVDGNGIVDDADVAKIQNGFNPVLSETRCDYFYLPLPDNGAQNKERKELEITAPNLDRQGKLEFEFLGVNSPAISAEPSALDSISPEGAQIKRDDVFWVGVKVSDFTKFADNADHAICGGITSLNLTIAYDSAYVSPALLPVTTKSDTADAQWRETLTRYNIGMGNDTANYWGEHYEIADGTNMDESYAVYYSKAILPMETGESKSTLRQMTISIRCTDTSYRRLVDEGGEYLARIPFKLHTYPFGQDSARVLDLGLGMRDFALFSRVVPDKPQIPQVAAAWNAQGDIFGGATWNLSDELAYVGGTARSIPLGVDDTPRVELINEKGGSIYGSEYLNKRAPQSLDPTKINLQLPQGLVYSTDGVIQGTPKEVGSFEFQTVSGTGKRTIYRIKIEKAPLTLTVTGQTRYYGEENEALDYTYRKEDIKPLDLGGGFTNNGNPVQLEKLAGFVAPILTTTVDRSTATGDYVIHITGEKDAEGENISGLQNYYFVYADTTLSTVTYSRETGAAPLVIKRRPIVIDKINSDRSDGANNALAPVSILASDFKTEFSSLTATYQRDTVNQFSASLPGTSYGGLKLSGGAIYDADAVSLTFTATLTHEHTAPPYYDFDNETQYQKEIPAVLSKVALTGVETLRNYELLYPYLKDTTGKATVMRNPIVKIELLAPSMPKMGPYEYGEPFLFSGMQVKLTYSDGQALIYQYVTEDSYKKIGVSVTWENSNSGTPTATEAQKLTNGQVLDVGVQDGKYLCVSVAGFDADKNPALIYAYSSEPFSVTKKQISLTVTPVEVYYGEYDANKTKLTYTYEPSELSAEDQAKLKADLHVTELAGTEAELSKLSGYVAPELAAMMSLGGTEPMTADAGVGTHVITIKNKKDSVTGKTTTGSDNYAFVYRNVDSPPLEWGKPGYNNINVRPRPIVVKNLAMSLADTPDSAYFLYDDTTDWTISRVYNKDDKGVVTPALIMAQGRQSVDAESKDTFIAGLPANDYCYLAGNNDQQTLKAPLDKAGEAIHKKADGTLDKVVLTYSAEYTRDNPAGNPATGTPFFTLGEGNTREVRNATVKGLALANDPGSDNANYVLVYDTLSNANTRRPTDNKTKGVVQLRSLSEVEVLAPATSRNDYAYGDQLMLMGMKLRLRYESEGDNNIVANAAIIDRTLNYSTVMMGGKQTNTFALQGLKMYWSVPGADKPDLSGLTDEQVTALLGDDVDSGNYPTLAESGKKLVLCGRRSDKHGLVWAETDDTATFKVVKKAISLTVENRYRYYGEPNGDYTAYYLYGALAKPDQDKLAAQYPGTAFTATTKLYVKAPSSGNTTIGGRDVTTAAVGEELLFVDSAYKGVVFTTLGNQSANVGKYAVDLNPAGSNMTNYSFTSGTSAQMTVFRRPVVMEKTTKNPVSTIYYNTPETEFVAYITQTGQGTATGASTNLYTVLPVGAGGIYESKTDPAYVAAVNAGMSANLTLTGNSIYGGDTLGVGMTSVFPPVGGRVTIPDSTYLYNQPITVKNMALSTGAGNYILVYTSEIARTNKAPTDPNATGRLDRRDIVQIEIIGNPIMEYTYGETLDLSELKVRITYEKLPGEGYNSVEEVYYYEYGGLSVNYWDSSDLPDDNGAGIAERPARAGDHLTRAPDHTPEKFIHNGKYLIVTARAHTSLGYAPPVLVSDFATGTPIQIKVDPLDLTYRFAAGDKVYDGTTKATGQMTLDNPYVAYVGDKADYDVVYVTTGAEYENPGVTTPVYSDYTELLARLKEKGYLFDSGSSGLTFSFFDKNVKYATTDDSYQHSAEEPVLPEHWQDYWNSLDHSPKTAASVDWDSYGKVASQPVLVSGITLAGPDANNYTLDASVNLTPGQNNVGSDVKDTVPYAVIEKAERPIQNDVMPQVSADVHTNAVKLTYTKPILAVQDTQDQYNSELHYEYGLEYMTKPEGETTNVVTRWGGADTWQDTYYFGGEKVECPLPDGYVPQEKPVEPPREDDIIKGQVYGWATAGGSWHNAADSSFGGREALPLDTVFWGVVRMAETHNYKASAPLSSSSDHDRDIAAAEEAARALSQAIKERVERNGSPQEDDEVDPAPIPAAAVKTFAERLKLISTAQEQGQDSKQYTVDTLESVWFTDILTYPKKELMDGVTRNSDPTRYYGYYWDRDHSAEIKFDESGLDLSEKLTIKINEKQPDGNMLEKDVDVNVDNRADVYVSTTSGGGLTPVKSVEITPTSVSGVLGGEPVQLTATVRPSYATYKKVTWSSSDERVVQVTSDGLLIFVGQGVATITATTREKKSGSITVRVSGSNAAGSGVGTALVVVDESKNMFDFYYTQPFLALDKENKFHPDDLMNRAELVVLLAQFYVDNGNKGETEKGIFPDLKGNEPCAAAAKLLGEQGIITGLPGGAFGADYVATRAEMAVILCRMMGLTPENTKGMPHAFADAGEKDTWAYSYIDALAKAGVLKGTGGGYFNPNGKLTKAEATVMLARILRTGGVEPQAVTNIPSDVPLKHWGYGAILRAINAVQLPEAYREIIKP